MSPPDLAAPFAEKCQARRGAGLLSHLGNCFGPPSVRPLARAVWAAHAAPEGELSHLLMPLSLDSQQAAKKLPGVPQMLKALERAGPPGASALLARARTRSGDGLNSFHGGIHPFARQRGGYPVALLDVTKNTNAFSMLTLLLLATLAEDLAIT